MKIAVSNLGVCQKQLKVEVPPAEVAEAREQVWRDLERVARVPGFRVGRAPRDLVVRHYAPKAREETIRRLIGEHLPKALEQAKLDLLGDPEVTEVVLDDGKPMVPPPAAGLKSRPSGAASGGAAGGGMAFTARCEIMPAVAVRHTKGIKVKRPAVAVADAKVTAVLTELQERHAELVPVEPRPLAAGDYAVIDFTCTVEGKEIERRAGAVIALKPEEDSSGMSRQLVGKAPSPDPVVFETTLPSDLPAKEYAGKPATFSVIAKEVKTKQVPLLDDAFAKTLGAESLEQLRARIRDDISRELTTQARRSAEEQVITRLIEQTPFEVPASLVQSQAARLLREAQLRLLYSGVGADEVKQRQELLTEQSTRDALRHVKVFFLLRQIAKDHELFATESEIEARIQALAERSHRTVQEVRAELQKERLLSEVAWEATRSKVLDWVLGQAHIEEAPQEMTT